MNAYHDRAAALRFYLVQMAPRGTAPDGSWETVARLSPKAADEAILRLRKKRKHRSRTFRARAA